jgi:lipopolysaccharide transport system ATP-binding protein
MGYLCIDHIGKAFKRYKRKSGRLAEWLGFGLHHELKWILHDITFYVESGESIGIIGINGAGKSTLLKIITGTTKPTKGKVDAGGRISALLELGLGFHPDFTGRQNAYMGAQLGGLSISEIDRNIDKIEEFAEIGDYFDQPIRTYSSGMQVRLAFSVATCNRPDILIVDEALSIGDTYFQHKSFDLIRKFKEQGTTLLFVSHSPAMVKTLCDRAMLLHKGAILRDDLPDAVLDYYNAAIVKSDVDYEIKQTETVSGKKITRSGGKEVTITSVELLINGLPARAVISRSPAVIQVVTQCNGPVKELTVGILIRDRLGNNVFGTNSFHYGLSRKHLISGERNTIAFSFPSFSLGFGSYSLTVALHSRDTHITENYDWWDRALVFQIIPDNLPKSIGVNNMPVDVRWVK